jgi:hypothetical protein
MTERGVVRESAEQPGATAGLVARLALAWALVGFPLAWGVWQVVRKSLDLFR